MRIPSGVTDQYLYFVAVDSTDFTTRETGLSSFTVYRSRNGGAAAAMTTPTINETDVTNMPGVYELLLDEDMTIDSGDDSQEMAFHITHAGMAPVTRTIELYRPKITAGETLTVTSGLASANATQIEGADATDQINAACDTAISDAALATAAELAKVPKSDGTSSWNATALAAINAEADTALSDYAGLQAADFYTRRNTAQAGASGSITLDASASSTNDLYTGQRVHIVSGTGAGQARTITAYNGTTKVATVVPSWSTNPASGSVFVITPASVNVSSWRQSQPNTLQSGRVDSYIGADGLSLGTASNQTSILNKIGLWTGSGNNTILGAMKAILSKVAAMPSDIGGTGDPTTDSLEAIRDTAPMGTAMRGTDSAALASVCTEARLAELDAANLPADVDTLLSRITSTLFSGITKLAEWLGLVAGKQTGDATALAEIRATGAGSGTFDPTTDSNEALRDDLGSQITTIDTVVDAIKVVTDALGSAAAAKLAQTMTGAIVGTVDDAAFTPTTTEFEADDIAEATADHYNGRHVLFISGALAGQETSISDYALSGANGHFTVVAMTEAPADGDVFVIL